MSSSDRAVAGPSLEIAAFCGDVYAERRAALQAAFEELDAVAVGDPQPLSAFDSVDATRDGILVFTDDRDSLPDGTVAMLSSVVVVTTDPDVASAAIERGVRDVCYWSPDDDPGLLDARLRQQFGDLDVTPDTGDAPEAASKRTNDAVISMDSEGTITYCNETMAKLLIDVDGSPVGDSIWDHLPDAVVEEVRAVVDRALETETATTTEVGLDEYGQQFVLTVVPSTDGVSIHARTRMPREPRPQGRSLYEYLIKTVGDAVYILDAEGRFTFVNDALCEMTGYDRETLIGSSVHLIKDDHTVEEAEDALRDLLRQRHDDGQEGIGIAKLDVELVTKDGEHVPCTDRMTLRPMEDGEFTGTVGTLRDITRQKRRENILGGLLEAAGEMVTAETTDEVAENVLRTATETLDIEHAVIRRHDPETDQLVPVAMTDAVEETFPDRPAYGSDEGPVGTAFTEQRLVVADTHDHLEETPDHIATSVYLPLGDSRALSVGLPASVEFDDDERRFVELLAATAAPVFDRVEREQERRRYEAVVEAADDMLFTVADGEFTLVTESFASALGRDRDSLRGTSLASVVADADIAAAIVSGTDETMTYETELLTAGGGRFPSRISVAPIEGEVGAAVVGTVRDISDLRSAQREASEQRRRFTELFETLADPVADLLYVDGSPVVRNVNAAFADLSQSDVDELRDTDLATVQSRVPDGVATALDPLADPETSIERDVAARTPSGERQYLLRSVPYEGDGVSRAFLILTDVTGVKQRETQLEVLYRLLRHNLRNRTTVIQGTAEEIAVRDDTDEFAPLGRRIYEASQDLVDASNTARTIQHVLEGGGSIDSKPVDTVAAEIEQRLAAEFDAEIPVRVETDGTVAASGNLLTAVRELVENALEHAADDPAVEVTLTERSDGGVSVAVHDDGPGVPDEEWAVVAGDREITQLQHASGLGLWLVKWVADDHGGTLRRGEDGDRNTVAIDLPR
jgi:PAS domain S-box-containing protein